ncbi:MAG: N4-gp56 family major capsid protein [Patescibacteria group bacterium]
MITTGTVTHRGVFYDTLMLTRLLPNLLHGLFAQIRDVPKNRGNVIRFRRYNNMTVVTDPLVEGVTPTATALTVTDVNATLYQYGAFVEHTDVILDTVEDPYLDELTQLIAEHGGQSLDTITREVLVAGTAVQYASTATSRGTVSPAMLFTLAEAREAVRTLKGNNVKKITRMQMPNGNIDTIPGNACFVALVHPNTTYDLKDEADFVPVELYPSQTDILPGEVGRMDEIRFIESTYASAFEDEGLAAEDVYPTLIFGADAYGVSRITTKEFELINHPPGSAGSADPLNQRGTNAWKAWFTAVILQQTAMLRVEHGCSIDA